MLDDFLAFLRFPSISTDPAYSQEVRACGEWLTKKLGVMGLVAHLIETPGHPVVVARSEKKPNRPTLLVYGHYDVQPVDPVTLWTHPPFEPHIENQKVYARGATDNKGQILGHILGAAAWKRERGDWPVNLIFLIEGEEESGSKHLAEFVRQHQEMLVCDVILVSDTGMLAENCPTISYGLRGLCAMELKITGPARDLHSGVFGGAVANPAQVLARLLATLHDEKGAVTIEGFYDDVQVVTAAERQAWAQLPFNDQSLLAATGALQLVGEKDYTALERIWARPTAEINGLTSGYQGEGTKTVLPSVARAKLTFRLVPQQSPSDILDKAEKHFRRHCPESVHLDIQRGEGGWPYWVDPQNPYVVKANAALQRLFPGQTPALVREGGSIPVLADLKRILGAEVVMVGWALPDAQIHSPNENFPLRHLELGLQFHQEFLQELAQLELPPLKLG